ncbi:MAG: flagellar biosynthesis protein FliQ [Clostridiales bacterium]|nr:flagellar biosynthesis protein FliQ [Clostridiales bacterium]
MSQDMVLEIFKEALILAFKLAGPLLVVGMLVGLVVAILQAATQVHEQTLTFVPKAVAVAVTLLLLGPWMINSIEDFMFRIFDIIGGL